MLQARKNEGTRAGRAFRGALAFAACLLAIVGPTATPAAAIFRAFSNASPWNGTAVPVASTNPYASQFADPPGFTMKLSGTPDNITHGSPIFFSQPGDPTAPVTVTQPDWMPKGDTQWDGKPVPVPVGVAPAPGQDGHLTVVSADRETAWEFLGCRQAGQMGYVAKLVAQWDLTGPGYSTQGENTSARGSGVPLISTSLRADEALRGIRHALGITVPRVSPDYIWPAAHSDGDGPNGGIEYGMRFVLRPDYPVPPNASIGVQNVIYSLKIFGAFVVDQGADFVMDADYTHPDLWQQAGLTWKSFSFTGADFRPAEPGIPSPLPPPVPATESVNARAVMLRAESQHVWVGHRLVLRGTVTRRVTAGTRARLEVLLRGSWRRLQSDAVRANGKFGVSSLLRHGARTSRNQRPSPLRLCGLRLDHAVRTLTLRAVVPGVGRSNVVRVGIRR